MVSSVPGHCLSFTFLHQFHQQQTLSYLHSMIENYAVCDIKYVISNQSQLLESSPNVLAPSCIC